MEELIFKDRHDAGIQLAAALTRRNYGPRDTVVFGIPRGGIIVADEVARCLSAPLDILVARKLRAPNQPDLGIGAVTLGEGNYFINEELAHVVGATPDYRSRDFIPAPRNRATLPDLQEKPPAGGFLRKNRDRGR